MKLHDVNMDAIREGARALLASYPDDPTGPTSVPARVHQILWEDDWWRGATMAREACARAFQADTEETRQRAGHGDAFALVTMQRRHRATCEIVVGEGRPRHVDLDQDQIDVLGACWAQMLATGCIERDGRETTGDIEGDHDELEEA
ncbi:MAG: hypothetical protein VW516_05745 [Rhodospirillaceae bacterium]